MNERLTTINHDDKSLKIPVNINIVEIQKSICTIDLDTV